jgi:hypothetical protein
MLFHISFFVQNTGLWSTVHIPIFKLNRLLWISSAIDIFKVCLSQGGQNFQRQTLSVVDSIQVVMILKPLNKQHLAVAVF